MDWRQPVGDRSFQKIYTHHQVEGANNADSVRQTDAVSHVKESLILTCYGDEPGVGGGCISGTHNAECEPKTWSEKVRFEDRNAVRHDDLWWMNHKNCWGRLDYPKDTNKYPTQPAAQAKYIQLAQNTATVASDAPMLGAAGQSAPAIPAPGRGTLLGAGAAAMQQIDSYREQSAVQGAAEKFGLNLSQPTDVLGARAYVWGQNMAPMSYGSVPFSGAANESVARSVMNTELAHPGTLGGAQAGSKEDKDRLDAAVAAGLAAAAAGSHRTTARQKERADGCKLVRWYDAACPEAQRHHVVAARAFRNVSGGISYGNGLVLCLKGNAYPRSLTTGHSVAQAAYDDGARAASLNGMLPLGVAESIGAGAAVLGARADGRECNAADFQAQLRTYHQGNNLSSSNLVRE